MTAYTIRVTAGRRDIKMILKKMRRYSWNQVVCEVVHYYYYLKQTDILRSYSFNPRIPSEQHNKEISLKKPW